MAIILDGKATSLKVKAGIKEQVADIVASGRRAPCLAVVLVGENPASQVYVRNKIRSSEETGITSKQYLLPEDTTEETLITLVKELNDNADIDGILVQLPLPKTINERAVIEAIAPEKDVDAFHPINVGKMFLGLDSFAPCTPSGIIRLLDEYGVEIAGKHCVVIGRSNIVGKPMAALLTARHGTVTVCHSKTLDISVFTKQADILVVAVGKPNVVDGSMIKDGAVVVDVGMNRVDGKLCGDCDFASCEAKASYITPVPGGVGPMTIAMLLTNTVKAYTSK